MQKTIDRRGIIIGVLIGALLLVAGCRPVPQPGGDLPGREAAELPESVAQALAAFNRGAAYIEQYRYPQAAEAFEEALAIQPHWTAARFNLGLAYLNLQGARGADEALDIARRTFEQVLEDEPEHRHALFSLGMYYQHLGDLEHALEYFELAYQLDPDDTYATYKMAESLLSVDRQEEGTEKLERVVAEQPGFPSAVYRLALQYQRRGEREKALPLFERFRELKDVELSAGAFTVGKIYGEAGAYSLVIGPDGLPLPQPEDPPPPRVIFSPETRPLGARTFVWNLDGDAEPEEARSGEPPAESATPAAGLPGLAAEDLNGNGHLDLVITGLDARGRTAVWFNDGHGRFTEGPTVADRGISPSLGDVNNNGHIDLWLGRAGPDLLLENDGQGQFQPVDLPGADADLLTVAARLIDIDSDGDLDLVACRIAAGSLPLPADAEPAAPSILCNHLDGTFDELADRLGLDTPGAFSVAVFEDFDNDRAIDLILFSAGDALPTIWVNQRVWQYRFQCAEEAGLNVRHVLGAIAGDANKSGRPDLLVFTRDGLELFANQGDMRFTRDDRFADQFGHLGGTSGQFVDLNHNGHLDILLFDAHRRDGTRGPVALLNRWPQSGYLDAGAVDAGLVLNAIRTKGDASGVAADFTGNGGSDLLLAPAGQEPVLIENVTEGGHWIGLRMVGTRGGDQKTRSSRSAIGARVEVHSGMVSQQYTVGGSAGSVAVPPLRLHAGLGPNPQLKWLRIIWPDGILQSELELSAGQVLEIEQTNRKPSSCPLLFAWTGSHYQFVSDFGGVGGLGYWLAPQTYATPDPTEYVPLPDLQAKDGWYELQVVAALEEVIYVDELKLIAVDHPAGTRVYPHEMAAISVPPPPFEVFCFDQVRYPVQATDHRGTDVTDVLRQVDRRYAGATDPHPHFVGFADEHYVELDFGEQLGELDEDDRWILVLKGWVEYSYSSTNFAAHQAGLRQSAPTLQAYRDGQWVTLLHEVGYPAGIQHTMTLDVTGQVLPSDRRLRIVSNMELFWDSIFLAPHRSAAELDLNKLPATSADLQAYGTPRVYSPDGRLPNLYDYHNVDSAGHWKVLEGDYTRFGEVGELLQQADNRFVIMAPGDQITLRFDAQAFGSVPADHERSFLLKTVSFCKDMDLATAYPDTVEPLPFHEMSRYPYGDDEAYPDTKAIRDYRRRYNTRQIRTRSCRRIGQEKHPESGRWSRAFGKRA